MRAALGRFWAAYLRIWPGIVSSRWRFYGIAATLGVIFVIGAVARGWLGITIAWVALIAIILLAIPTYSLPWDEDD